MVIPTPKLDYSMFYYKVKMSTVMHPAPLLFSKGNNLSDTHRRQTAGSARLLTPFVFTDAPLYETIKILRHS